MCEKEHEMIASLIASNDSYVSRLSEAISRATREHAHAADLERQLHTMRTERDQLLASLRRSREQKKRIEDEYKEDRAELRRMKEGIKVLLKGLGEL
jgi:predicted  nucleic acid-binding Zn-ribbon protein